MYNPFPSAGDVANLCNKDALQCALVCLHDLWEGMLLLLPALILFKRR